MPKHTAKGTYPTPVSDAGTSETGRGAKKFNAIKKNLAHQPNKLTEVETGKHKKDFKP